MMMPHGPAPAGKSATPAPASAVDVIGARRGRAKRKIVRGNPFPIIMTKRLPSALLLIVVAACCRGSAAGAPPKPKAAPAATRPAFEVGRFATGSPIRESSGVVASRRHPGVYWTHGDSGTPPALYAVTRAGELLAEFPVAARNEDWEDVAADEDGQLYIGEIGNNGGKKKELAVYRVDEPDPKAAGEGRARERLRVTATWRLRFPGQPFDCESLFIRGGYGYVISKVFPGLQAGLYRFALTGDPAGPVVLEYVTAVPARSPVTAADLSPDGRRLAVLTVTGVYLFDVEGDWGEDKAVTLKPTGYLRHLNLGAEAVCFVPDGLLAMTEGGQVLLFGFEDLANAEGRDPEGR